MRSAVNIIGRTPPIRIVDQFLLRKFAGRNEKSMMASGTVTPVKRVAVVIIENAEPSNSQRDRPEFTPLMRQKRDQILKLIAGMSVMKVNDRGAYKGEQARTPTAIFRARSGSPNSRKSR